MRKRNRLRNDVLVESKQVIANIYSSIWIHGVAHRAYSILLEYKSRRLNRALIASRPITIDCPGRPSRRLFVRKGRVLAALVIPIAGESYLLRGRSSRACHKSWCERGGRAVLRMRDEFGRATTPLFRVTLEADSPF